MLNRLYIVVGVLAIIVITAAFLVPRMIQWGDYRGRMQAIAAEALGAPVEIVGDIEFSLLPQPQLKFGDVLIGPEDKPAITIASVEADFSLIDFLRDRYHITRLVLRDPAIEATINADGGLETSIAIADAVSTSNVSVARAEIVNGAVTLSDARSGADLAATNINGELTLAALRGPFTFQGSAGYGGRVYATRIATSTLDEDGASQLSLYLRPRDEAFTLSAEGRLVPGASPTFAGTVSYEQAPPKIADGEPGDVGRGNLVLTGKVEASTARVLLSEYVLVPDANRAATRLQGAAELRAGAEPSFNVVVSGGMFGLPPRDMTTEDASAPYEFIRLLNELPVPPTPAIPGTVGVDILEVDLRAFALRNVRFDARADSAGWTLDHFAAQLPGGAALDLKGTLNGDGGRPNFAGTVGIRAARLETLAQLWRKPRGQSALFQAAGGFSGELSLVGETLSVSNGTLTIKDHEHAVSAEIGFAPATRHLNIRADFGAMDAAQSEALFALLPDVMGDARFGATFPAGRFDLRAAAANLGGIAGDHLAAAGSWEGGVLTLDTLSAAAIGGVGLDAQLTAFGTVARPEISGTAKVSVSEAKAPGLAWLYDRVGTPAPLRDWFAGSLPANLSIRLDAPSGEGGQSFLVSGDAGAAALTLSGKLGVGVLRALNGPMALRLSLTSDDPTALTAQLGLGSVSLTPDDAPMSVVAVVEGTASNSLETTIRIEGGDESIGFAGNVIASNLERLNGNGNLQASLSDVTGLLTRFGMGGLSLPAFSGAARLDFDGGQRVKLSQISATAGDVPVRGEVVWTRAGADLPRVEGTLELGELSPEGLLALLAGPAATLNSGVGFWADGPVALGQHERLTTGRLAVTAPRLVIGDAEVGRDASFALTWDRTTARLRDLKFAIGDGSATAEITVCCAGALPEKQLGGRLSLTHVALADLLPAPVAAALSATVDLSARFEGTGDSLLGALAALTGEGSYTLDGLTIQHLDPAAFGAVTSLADILDLPPDAVTAIVVDRLDDAPFVANPVSGGFTIAGGVLRSPNLAIENAAARLFGTANLRLADLMLSGGFTMSPKAPTGPDGSLTEANAAIVANLGGTLPAPSASYDVGGVVDTLIMQAFEAEVARLEEIRAADQARQREAAAERARLAAEEDARRAAEAEAKRLAEEEAARQAAEAEAARRAAEEARRATEAPVPAPAPVPPADIRSPSIITLQPGFNLTLPESPTQF